MVPVLFHVGGLPVDTHDFFVFLGVCAATTLFFSECRRRNVLTGDLAWVAAGALFGGGLGARVGDLWNAIDPSALQTAGKTVLGGLTGAYAGAVVAKRVIGYRAGTGDLFAPGVALGMAIGRWGCFLTEQVGTPTTLPWGIAVSSDAAVRIPNCPGCAAGVPMHPSFLYEVAFHAIAFVTLLRFRDEPRFRGDLLKLYLLAYAVFRFAVEFVRGNPPVWEGLSQSQLFLIPSTLLLAAYVIARQRGRRGAPIGGVA